jgi:myo-inositol-1(or 4)-monophosphatase
VSITSASQRAELAATALLVAEEAATLVAAGYRSRPRSDEKAPHDLVTEFDRASERLLVARLGSLAPGIPVVGEEASALGTKGRPGLVWYVDPLDGTTNFVHGHPFWSVAVGLMEDDRPVAGAVVAPVVSLRWHGHVPPGTAVTLSDGAPAPSGPRQSTAFRNGAPCSVSTVAQLGDALVATGFPAKPDRAPDDNFDSFIAVQRVVQGVRRCGSAAMDLCMVADGTYDGYWERALHAWDTVAASAVVLAAGGTVTALDGGTPDYHVGHVVASNGLLHAALVGVLAASGSGAPSPAP